MWHRPLPSVSPAVRTVTLHKGFHASEECYGVVLEFSSVGVQPLGCIERLYDIPNKNNLPGCFFDNEIGEREAARSSLKAELQQRKSPVGKARRLAFT